MLLRPRKTVPAVKVSHWRPRQTEHVAVGAAQLPKSKLNPLQQWRFIEIFLINRHPTSVSSQLLVGPGT